MRHPEISVMRVLARPAILFLLGIAAECALIAFRGIAMSSREIPTNPGRGTIFVVAQPNITMLLGWGLAFPFIYALWPFVTKRALTQSLGQLHFALTFTAFTLGYVVLQSQAREISIDPATGHMILPSRWFLVERIARVALVVAQFPLLYNLAKSLIARNAERAS